MTSSPSAVLLHGRSGSDQQSLPTPDETRPTRGGTARRIAAVALLSIPVVLIVWMGWRHRWTADDGFINLRIVRNIVDGHGPVFNPGERVEVGTSPLWLLVLSVLDVTTPFRLEWIAAIGALAATGGAVALAVVGTRRAEWPTTPAGAVLVPLGALVYAALPPAWDFATSGLENGLALLWIATCWLLLCRRVAMSSRAPAPRWWVPIVLGLGPLVRPDFAIFSVTFVVALLVLCERRAATVGRVLAFAALVPVLTELARIAYFGSLVPNTAIAKEASSSNWAQGWSYFADFVSSYALTVPILLLLAWWFIAARRPGADGVRRYGMVALLVVAGGVLHATYIVRVGGDFMHARMLLPTTFVLLLPVSVVAVRGRGWWLAAAVVSWALACGLWLRPPYSAALPPGVSSATASDPFDARTGIADERLFWVRTARTAHPVTLDDYLPDNGSARAGARVARWADAGRRGLLLDPSARARSLVPVRPGVNARIVVSAPALGLFGYAAGDQVEVVDNHGLASPLAAHQRVGARGRPGHEKDLQDAWLLAEFADHRVAPPAGMARSDVRAARRALSCEPLRSLFDRSTRTLTVGTVLDNVDQAMTSFSYRFAPDPIAAAREACGTGQP